MDGCMNQDRTSREASTRTATAGECALPRDAELARGESAQAQAMAERAAEALGEVLSLKEQDSIVSAMSSSMAYRRGGKRDEDEGSLGLMQILTGGGVATDSDVDLQELRNACWHTYKMSPFVQQAYKDRIAALFGNGFSMFGTEDAWNERIRSHVEDPRNRLYSRLKPWMLHRAVNGELWTALTAHLDEAFVETDFVGPEKLTDIIWHPGKDRMHLVFIVKAADGSTIQIPSINLAYFPGLLVVAKKDDRFDASAFRIGCGKPSRSLSKGIKGKLPGGMMRRFITEFEGPVLTRRNTSELRTVIIWNNLYTMMKLVELDHKRALATYAYVFGFSDRDAWELWSGLTPDTKAETGILRKKPPGSDIILPPGMTMKAVNPNLPANSDTDNDIQEHVTSGLGAPRDMTTNTAKGTHSNISASRGPFLLRNDAARDDLEQFLRFDFWRPIFFLLHKIHGIPAKAGSREVVGYEGEGKQMTPKTRRVLRDPWHPDRLGIHFPPVQLEDSDSLMKAIAGTKHRGLHNGFGVPGGDLASRVGIPDYPRARLRKGTEDLKFPPLNNSVDGFDDESTQERELEPGKEGR